MSSYAKSWPTAACRDCRLDHPREVLTKVVGGRTHFNVCPACLGRRQRLKIKPFEKSA